MSEPSVAGLSETLEIKFQEFNRIVTSNLNKEITERNKVLNALNSGLKSLLDFLSVHKDEVLVKEQIKIYHDKILEILDKVSTEISSDAFSEILYKELKESVDQVIYELPVSIRSEYSEAYFINISHLHYLARIKRRTENTIFRIRRGIIGGINLLRKILRAKEKEFSIPRHNIYYRDLVCGYLLPIYYSEIENLLQEVKVQTLDTFGFLFDQEYRHISKEYRTDEIQISVNNKIEYQISQNRLSEFFAKNHDNFKQISIASGSMLSLPFYQKLRLRWEFRKSTENLERAIKLRQSTYYSFFEDWRFRERLFSYIAFVKSTCSNVENIYTERIKKTLLPEIENQINYTNTILGNLSGPEKADMETIKSFLVKELYKLKKQKFSQNDKSHKIQDAAKNIPRLLGKLDSELTGKLKNLDTKVGVVKNPDYKKGVKPSDIYYFNPTELIEFEFIPGFRNRNSTLQKELEVSLENIVREFEEYEQIIDYYLDSAILLTEKPGITADQVIQVFKDGLNRLLNISYRISDLLQNILQTKIFEISENIKNYLVEVEKLDDNNNILNIYSRLLKAKAIAESVNKRKRVTAFFKKLYKSISDNLQSYSAGFKNQITDLRKKLKLDRGTESISSEISNYLADIQKRIYKLPLIYQHLFESKPVNEFNLFLSREDEVEKLNSAYRDWLAGNFAATLITGENGSGKSSLLHFYSSTLKSKYQIIKFEVSRFYYNDNDYYKLINEIFGREDLNSDVSIDQYVVSLTERKIVILDGLERVFLRKVNGFNCLGKLLSLIVATNYKIFWLCSISKYASVYLNKTYALAENFDYIINIDNLSYEQIKTVILKRNRISGFQVHFQEDNGTKNSSDATRESQEQLEENYFYMLNKFADSNISLSLNYWLQSISSIKGDDIYIGSFKTPDFSFMEGLSQEKVYTLLLILVHGKLTVELHSLLCNMKYERSFKILNILKEDSILVRQGDYFTLNGILFRHVIKLLEIRNLIH